jgi:hypothetical protein
MQCGVPERFNRRHSQCSREPAESQEVAFRRVWLHFSGSGPPRVPVGEGGSGWIERL